MPNALDMTGFWVGTYRYDAPGEPVVPFVANIEERDGILSGTISEPNPVTYSSDRLSAFVKGARSSVEVDFAKVYDGEGDMAHRVDYVGLVGDDGLSVTGRWTLPGATGSFQMTRERIVEADMAIEAETISTGLLND